MPREYGGFNPEAEPKKDYKNMNYYDLLGVTQGASTTHIKKTYRDLMKSHHPDIGGDLEYSQYLTEAYGTLKDKDKRSQYDAKLGYKKAKTHHSSSTGSGSRKTYNASSSSHSRKTQPPPKPPENPEPEAKQSREQPKEEAKTADSEIPKPEPEKAETTANKSKEAWEQRAQASKDRWASRSENK